MRGWFCLLLDSSACPESSAEKYEFFNREDVDPSCAATLLSSEERETLLDAAMRFPDTQVRLGNSGRQRHPRLFLYSFLKLNPSQSQVGLCVAAMLSTGVITGFRSGARSSPGDVFKTFTVVASFRLVHPQLSGLQTTFATQSIFSSSCPRCQPFRIRCKCWVCRRMAAKPTRCGFFMCAAFQLVIRNCSKPQSRRVKASL